MGKLAWYHASPWISIYYGKTEWDSKVMLMAKSQARSVSIAWINKLQSALCHCTVKYEHSQILQV